MPNPLSRATGVHYRIDFYNRENRRLTNADFLKASSAAQTNPKPTIYRLPTTQGEPK